MLAEEESELLTRIGPGTPCGELMRRYWQPVALAEEAAKGAAPLPVRLLGEDLVLFRDDQGRPGLLGLHCSHRGADLSYGRLEDGGIRCIYHGWLYDVHGRCLEQPGEPAPAFRWTSSGGRDPAGSAGFEAQSGASDWASRPDDRSQFRASESVQRNAGHEKIRHPAYPCIERAGTIFAYLGPGEPPFFPNYEFLLAPDGQFTVTKRFHECNYLQANEGNIDLSHLSFLHYMSQGYRGMSQRYRAGEPASDGPISHRGAAPGVETADVQPTPYGLRSCRISRDVGPDDYRFDITEFVLPSFTAFWVGPRGDLTGKLGYSVNWHVPIDDTHHWKYTYRFGRDSEPGQWGRRSAEDPEAQYHPTRNLANRFLQDRATMASESYTGMGPDFFIHDKWATESQGPIQDRTREHLGALDRALVVARQILRKAILDLQEGREPANVVRDSARNHFPIASCYVTVPNETSWRDYCVALESEVMVGGERR